MVKACTSYGQSVQFIRSRRARSTVKACDPYVQGVHYRTAKACTYSSGEHTKIAEFRINNLPSSLFPAPPKSIFSKRAITAKKQLR